MDDVCGSEEWIILSLIIKYKTKYRSQGAGDDWLRKTFSNGKCLYATSAS